MSHVTAGFQPLRDRFGLASRVSEPGGRVLAGKINSNESLTCQPFISKRYNVNRKSSALSPKNPNPRFQP